MLNIIILAAGQGKRMYSDKPKVLQPLAGQPLLQHVINTARMLSPSAIYVVYGHQGELVKAAFADTDIQWIHQKEQRGTAHAVEQVLPHLANDSVTLVLYGDVPLVSVATLQALCGALPEQSVALLVAELVDPTGLGRIVRNKSGQIACIVEEKDCDIGQRQINEIYSGIMVIHTHQLRKWLSQIDNNNAQKEFYLTAIPALAIAEGHQVTSITATSEREIMGVNTKAQLATLEREFQLHQANAWMAKGITFLDPARFDLRGNLSAGRDVSIDVNVILEGDVVLGDRVSVGANTVLRNVTIANDVTIKENCVIENATIHNHCVIGPFSRVRPGTELAENVHIGNFVEIKKSSIQAGTKISHLSYIGDAHIGTEVNIGAGTITCNYDGINKHVTTIGDHAFVGSNTSLVAPITIGENATIGAGSTVAKSVPADQLTLARAKQTTVAGWKRPQASKK